MASSFEPNPAFMPQLEAATRQALLALQFQIRDEVERDVAPTQVKKHVTVKMNPASKDGREIAGRIYYGRGFGAIFDKGTVQRTLKGRGKFPAGANRGRISTASRAMDKGRESAIRRGLDLSRYL